VSLPLNDFNLSINLIKNTSEKIDGTVKMIIKKGRQWILKSKDGKKVLGRHTSKKDAMAQERAIQISQAREQKRDI